MTAPTTPALIAALRAQAAADDARRMAELLARGESW